MSDLTNFLLARIGEDEEIARLAASVTDDVNEDWQDVTQPITHAQTQGRPQESWSKRYGYAYEHISRHDPARVLAECEAKRRIVDEYQSSVRSVSDGLSGSLRRCIQALALPYADHPDYRDEWRA